MTIRHDLFLPSLRRLGTCATSIAMILRKQDLLRMKKQGEKVVFEYILNSTFFFREQLHSNAHSSQGNHKYKMKESACPMPALPADTRQAVTTGTTSIPLVISILLTDHVRFAQSDSAKKDNQRIDFVVHRKTSIVAWVWFSYLKRDHTSGNNGQPTPCREIRILNNFKYMKNIFAGEKYAIR